MSSLGRRGVGGTCRAALAAIRRRRVSELDVLGDVMGGSTTSPPPFARRSAKLPSGLVAVTTQRSPFFTQRPPVVTRRLF